ncbi:MAG: Gfo/Idh/MocA family protein [Gammaproteobacteria bacterium]
MSDAGIAAESPLRVGILGAAQIVPAALIEPASELSMVTIAAIAARDPARAAQFAAEHLIPRVADDYAQLVADPAIDLIYNALPISEHARWSEAALRAGKHVLCEKPLAMNRDEVQRMLQAASPQARLIEAFHCRYHPAYDTLLDWLRDPAAGAVVSISAHFNVGITDDGSNIRYRPALGGGAMMDLGCYPVLWALLAAGAEPAEVEASAVMTASGVDESMHATLHFEQGAKAHLSCSMDPRESFTNALRIATDHSHIEFDNPLLPQQGRLMRRLGEHEESVKIDSGSTYAHQLERVARALIHSEPLPTESEALLVQQRTLDRIYAAADLTHLRYR